MFWCQLHSLYKYFWKANVCVVWVKSIALCVWPHTHAHRFFMDRSSACMCWTTRCECDWNGGGAEVNGTFFYCQMDMDKHKWVYFIYFNVRLSRDRKKEWNDQHSTVDTQYEYGILYISICALHRRMKSASKSDAMVSSIISNCLCRLIVPVDPLHVFFVVSSSLVVAWCLDVCMTGYVWMYRRTMQIHVTQLSLATGHTQRVRTDTHT